MKKNYSTFLLLFLFSIININNAHAVAYNADALSASYKLLNAHNVVRVLDTQTSQSEYTSNYEVNLVAVANCQNITVQLDGAGNATITEDAVNNGSTGVGALTFDTDITSFTCANLGPNAVILTVTDTFDSSVDTCNATVTIEDNINPTASNPAPISAQCTLPAADTSLVIDEADNCGVPTVTHQGDSSDGNSCPEVVTRTYRVTDTSGNFIDVTQTITIDDTTNPTASNPAAISVQCAADVPAPDVNVVTTEADNCTANPTVAFVSDTALTPDACGGTITRTYSVTDDCGNSINVTQTITVDDTIIPVLAAAPGDVTVECIGDVPAMTDLAWTDNCDGAGTVTGSDSALSGGNECGGTITRTWNYTDSCGNLAATRTQIITVDDNTDPTASNPTAISVQCETDVPTPDVNVVTDENDNCSTPTVAFVSDTALTPDACGGTITRTYSVTDDCGNSINVTQTITVDDTIIPVLAAAPGDVTVECIGDVPAMTDLAWTDNCDGAGTVTGSDSALSGGNECGGTITRTWNYTDSCGNLAATRTQIITVDDNTDPTASNPTAISVQCETDVPTPDITVVTDENDNCSTPTVAFVSDTALTPDACGGTITRTYSVTDDCGNSINVTQTITVDDTIIPVLAAAPGDVTVECIGDVPAMTDLAWTDNCDGAGTVTGSDSALSGGNECGGTITRTWNYTDSCGNLAATRTQIITVDDNTDPTASNPTAISVQCETDVPTPDITVVTDENDNCSTPTVAFVSDTALTPDACGGTITRTYSVTDDCGNSINVTQTITVDDTIIPVLAAAPGDVTVECIGDVPAMTDLAWTDNCDGAGTVTGSDSALSGGNECGGTITRTWNYTDSCGNLAATRTQIITVDDNTDPTASNPTAISVQCETDVPTPDITVVTDENDNCSTPTVAFVSDTALTPDACGGTITRTYSVTDDCGNSINVTQTITVDDTIIPVLAAAPGDVTVECIGDVPAMTDLAWTDNCDGAGTVTGSDSALSGGNECGGTITRTWNYTDSCGNLAATRTQIITVDDNTDPTASNPTAISVQCETDVPTPDITVVTDENDNCSTPTVAFVSDTALTPDACGGTITRTYSVTDDCGNSINVTQTITVDDTIIPVLAAAPGDVTVECIGDVPAMTDLAWTDNCDGAGTVTGSDSALSGGNECGGTITRTWNYTDSCGNLAATRTQIITVDDNTDPTASNPTAISVQCETDVPTPDITVVTDENDNCSTPTVAFVSDTALTPDACGGTITRTYSVTDDCGNSINVTQTITVDDTIIPVLAAAPGDVTVECIGDVPAMTDLAWTDNCDGAGTVTGSDSALSGGNECGGTITRTWNYTDSCGNLAATRTQIITVDDNTDPTASNPTAISVQCETDVPTPDITVVTDENDNCSTPTVAFVSDTALTPDACGGTITRTYSVTDDCGNSINVTQTITVDDTIIPVLAAAPGDVTVECIGDVPAMTDLAWTDNCDGAGTVTGSDSALSGGNECGGTITRTWNYTDSCGNLAATRTQIITVDDNTDPTASNPTAISVQCETDVPTPDITVVTDENDNCSTPTVAFVSDTALTPDACGGTITRTYSVTDDCGNSINVTQTITVDDTIIPVLAAAPGDVTVECIGDVPAMTDLAWTDNCDGAGTVTGSDSALSGGNECGGTITRTWNYTDSCGNLAATRTQIITVDDNTDPTASNPTAISVQCETDVPTPDITVVTDENDNCSTPTVAFVSDTALTPDACGGTITRTYSVTDDCGNSINVTQTITVDDTIIPVLAAAPGDVTVECIGDVPAMTDLAWTDNCDGAGTVTGSDSALSGGNECGGTITRTWNYTDSCGNLAATRTQIITVDDNTDPTASNPTAISVQCETDVPTPDITVVTDENDNCSTPTVAFVSDTALTPDACGGTITRTYSVTDDCGNSINVTQTITVDDTIIPVLAAAPGDVTVECIGDVPAMTDLAWTDNCDGAGTVTGSDSALSGGNECGGTITRTWNYTDSCGNLAATRTQIITVDDNTDPTASNPTAISVQCETDVPTPDITVVTDENDNCSTPTVAFVSDTALTPDACGGTITRTYSVTDDCGNSINVTQTITVDDTIIPVLAAAPGDVTVECIGDVPAMTDLAWTDNCDGAGTVTGSDSALSGGNECGGTITRTWNYTDSCGNLAATRTQIITVDDNTDPTASNPTAISVQCAADVPAPDVNVVTTEADNCTANPTVAFVSDTALAPNACGGTITRTYSVTDDCGNAINVTQTITVDDTIDPVLAGVPANTTAECDSIPVVATPTASDNCDTNVTITFNETSTQTSNGTCTDNNYTITRTWTATDNCTNTDVGVQTITVSDNTNPIITTCLGNQNVSFDSNCGFTLPNYTSSIVATDNCSSVTITQSPAPGTIISNTTTITITATDTCGNSTSTCSFDVIPSDTTNPNALCLDITVPLDATGNVNIFASDVDNGSNDNCGIATRVITPSSFTCADIGPNTVTLTITDTNGNIDTCTATVTIVDDTPPNASCGSITFTLDSVTGLYTLNNTEINSLYTGSGDTCGSVTLSLAQTTFECDDIGTNNVVLTITDPFGNESTCNASITVEAPIITSGTLTGIVVDPAPDPPVPADDLIEVTACPGGVAEPKDVELTLTLDASSTIVAANIQTWQISTNNGDTWTNVAGTSGLLQYTLLDLLETTLVRLVIQSGDCVEYSPLAVVRFLPPDVPPTIVYVSNTQICLGDSVDLRAESFFEGPGGGQWGDGGLFNHAQPDGWRVDGEDGEFPASGDNQSEPTWKETNGPTYPGGIRYDTSDNTKFAIAWGPYTSTLETPIFHTVGMTAADAIMEFHQAYYFCNGAQGIIELSLDGGDTYDIVLNTMQGDNLTSPSDSGTQVNGKNGTNCGNGPNGQKPTSDPLQLAQLDLGAYINMSNLRVRFTYDGLGHGRCNGQTFPAHPDNQCNSIPSTFNVWSTWAIDDVGFPYAYIEEELEWTDEEGVIISTGAEVSVTPVTPGIREFGVTSLVNGCRDLGADGTEFINIYTSLAYAGQDFSPAAGDCGQSLINLKAYDNTATADDNFADGAWEPGLYVPGSYLGTGMTGTWSAVPLSPGSCGTSALFSSNSNPRATFSADPGTYRLRWTLANGCFDEIDVTITSCDYINFDGIDDFVTLRNNYSINSAFSLEAWIKPNNITGTRTVFSKRNSSDTDSGYNLNVEGGTVKFYWYSASGDGVISSQYPINTSRWYHLAVTFDGANYVLYVDGISVGQVTGTVRAPDATSANVEALIGAIDQDNGSNNNVGNYFNGWIDELKIWNQALTVNQIRMMMNQEILDNTTVRGEVIPMDVAGLNWTSLDGYYRMGINCGNLNAYKGASGRLRNINSPQDETAPLPYISNSNGLWTNDNIWLHPSVWDVPNSIGIDNSTPIDWNIVRTGHNISSGDKDITVLGLLVDANELSIEDPGTSPDETNEGQMLWVTHYLKLDGKLDLVGESQLIQKRYNASQINGSIFDNTSTGIAERDQQGTLDAFNYNYFSSPFAPGNAIVSNENTSNTYSIGAVLRDGTTTVADPSSRLIAWTTDRTAYGGDPTEVSTRWLYAYNNRPGNTYSEWEYLNNTGTLNIGLGYTQKGSGNTPSATNTEQNYVFVGLPNNGIITNTVSPEVAGLANDILLGNPYPSAIDADEFIRDNIPGANGNSGSSASINGTLYFWDHYDTGVFSHILEQYEGGYGIRNLTGGTAALSPPITEDGIIIAGGNGTLTPNRYIPVGQGFFVTGSPSGGLIKFENDQRTYYREGTLDGGNSIFFGPNTGGRSSSKSTSESNDLIQRIRLNFKSPEGANRTLLIGFTPNNEADDGYNYGYDAHNYDDFPSDLSWSINNEKFIIQGVGPFDTLKKYPFILELGINGTSEISLTELENFDSDIDVYIYDSLLETYTKFNEIPFEINLDAGDYMDRYYLAFYNPSSLSIPEDDIDALRVNYLNDTNEIYINWINSNEIKEVELINIIGQSVKTWTNLEPINSHEIKIPVKNISEGNYVIKVMNKEGMTTNKKVIITQ